MRRLRIAPKWLVWAGAALLVYLAVAPLKTSVLTLRLMRGLQALAAGDSGADLAVTESTVQRVMAGLPVTATIYCPAAAEARRAVILVPGITPLGHRHPRLVALSRILADKGFCVLTPDIPALRQLRIDPTTADHISFWLAQLRSLEQSRRARQVGLAGVSFSGTMALRAAALPENRRAAAFVLAIGPYSDLAGCADGWFAAGPVAEDPGRFPTRYYGRWIVMLGALDLIREEPAKVFLRQALTDLLLEKESVEAPPHDLDATALRWYRLATAREGATDPALARQIIDHVLSHMGSRLSPDPAAASVECPVFLAHGLYDDLIPPSESESLRAKIRHAPSHLLVSPFVTHTHPAAEELSPGAKVKAASEMFLFLYRLLASGY